MLGRCGHVLGCSGVLWACSGLFWVVLGCSDFVLCLCCPVATFFCYVTFWAAVCVYLFVVVPPVYFSLSPLLISILGDV